MVINGKELNFKVSKRSDAANFEKAIKDMAEKEKEIQKMDKNSLSEILGALEDMFRDFFVAATGIDVVDTCDDLEEIKGMYYTFLKEVEKQKKAFLAAASVKGK